MAFNKKAGSGGRRVSANRTPNQLERVPVPVAIVNKVTPTTGSDPRVDPILDKLNCGSVGIPKYSWCATNQGSTKILANTCITFDSVNGVRALTSSDTALTTPLLISLTDINASSNDRVYQFGQMLLDNGINWLPNEIMYCDPKTGLLNRLDSVYTVPVAFVIRSLTGTEVEVWFDPTQFKSGDVSLMRGWMDATVVDGGLIAPIIDGSSAYLVDEYVIVLVEGEYDFSTGVPLVGGTLLQVGDRVRYTGLVWDIIGQPQSTNRGFFDPNLSGGGPGVPDPVMDADPTGTYLISDYVIVIDDGEYDFVTGEPLVGGTTVENGDRIIYNGAIWIVQTSSGKGLIRGWMDASVNGGGGNVPTPIVDGSADYFPNEYVIVETAGQYDFSAGAPGVGQDLQVGDRVRYDGALWSLISEVATGIITDWLTLTNYIKGAYVREQNTDTLYRCLTAHTSDVFKADIDTGLWAPLTGMLQIGAEEDGAPILQNIKERVLYSSGSVVATPRPDIVPNLPTPDFTLDGNNVFVDSHASPGNAICDPSKFLDEVHPSSVPDWDSFPDGSIGEWFEIELGSNIFGQCVSRSGSSAVFSPDATIPECSDVIGAAWFSHAVVDYSASTSTVTTINDLGNNIFEITLDTPIDGTSGFDAWEVTDAILPLTDITGATYIALLAISNATVLRVDISESLPLGWLPVIGDALISSQVAAEPRIPLSTTRKIPFLEDEICPKWYVDEQIQKGISYLATPKNAIPVPSGNGFRLRFAKVLSGSGVIEISWMKGNGTAWSMVFAYSIAHSGSGGSTSLTVITGNAGFGDLQIVQENNDQHFELVANSSFGFYSGTEFVVNASAAGSEGGDDNSAVDLFTPIEATTGDIRIVVQDKLVIKEVPPAILEYASGKDYSIDDLFSQVGSIYRVIAPMVASNTVVYSKCECIMRGSGDAAIGAVDLSSNRFVRIAIIETYTACRVKVGGIWNGIQCNFTADINTNYSSAMMDVSVKFHNSPALSQFSLIQPNGAGTSWELWVKTNQVSASLWNMHVTLDATGNRNLPSSNAAVVPYPLDSSPSINPTGPVWYDLFCDPSKTSQKLSTEALTEAPKLFFIKANNLTVGAPWISYSYFDAVVPNGWGGKKVSLDVFVMTDSVSQLNTRFSVNYDNMTSQGIGSLPFQVHQSGINLTGSFCFKDMVTLPANGQTIRIIITAENATAICKNGIATFLQYEI